jgi:PKD repeat protein
MTNKGFTITDISYKYDLVYIHAQYIDNEAQKICLSMDIPSFNKMNDDQLSREIISALAQKYPSESEINLSIMGEFDRESVAEIVKERINNKMSNLQSKFIADPISGAAPLEVIFINKSYGMPSEYIWDFGDEGSSARKNVVHTYESPGIYTVSLTVIKNGQSNTKTYSNMITVT